MKKITLKIEDDKLSTFIELIKSLDYVRVSDPDKELLKLQQREVARRDELIAAGKMKTRNWEEAKADIFNSV